MKAFYVAKKHGVLNNQKLCVGLGSDHLRLTFGLLGKTLYLPKSKISYPL